MDNLASRPEVVSALSQEFGFCRRMSPTLGVDSLFVAKAIRRGDHFSGWIRASETAESVTARLRAIERSTLTAAAIASIVAAVLGALWMNVRLQRGAAGTD